MYSVFQLYLPQQYNILVLARLVLAHTETPVLTSSYLHGQARIILALARLLLLAT
jgi:hypothetical protein